jgi:hypothetical protein
MSLLNFQVLDDDELIHAYGDLLLELKKRKIIRSKNVIGDLGEYTAIAYYKNAPSLPTLTEAPPNTKAFDAVGRNGKRYSIKTTTGKTTGCFFGLPPAGQNEPINPMFDFVVIVKFDNNYNLELIVEITWEQFLVYKRWLPTQNAYNLYLNGELLSNAKSIYRREK